MEISPFTSRIQELAAGGVMIGTSSWKYPGWLGQIYEGGLYQTRSKFSKAKFEANCLTEYARTFSTVCVDAGYYAFPSAKWLAGLVEQVPPQFRFGFKVTDEVTMAHFPNLRRFGKRAGQENPHFLDAELFARAFLAPCETVRENIGPLIFEFSHFSERDFVRGRDFLPLLDRFLGELPPDWQYAVEIRNSTLLHAEYFAVLKSHSVAHCYNSWERMPPVPEQLQHEDSRTTDFLAARLLLTPGRKYAGAVEAFQPYTHIQSPDPEVRQAARTLIEEARVRKARLSYFFVNNRLEGNALQTIAAILDCPPPVKPQTPGLLI